MNASSGSGTSADDEPEDGGFDRAHHDLHHLDDAGSRKSPNRRSACCKCFCLLFLLSVAILSTVAVVYQNYLSMLLRETLLRKFPSDLDAPEDAALLGASVLSHLSAFGGASSAGGDWRVERTFSGVVSPRADAASAGSRVKERMNPFPETCPKECDTC
eukprot:g11465.t1